MPGLAVIGSDPGTAGPGFHGKVPTHGDFVTRRLPRAFVAPWDEWLQAAISCSRDQLGDAWLPAYLTCPVWRFVLSAGLCGEQPAAGLLMPSVDKVGRYFPFVLAAPLPNGADPATLAARAGDWFDGLEALALSALDDGFDLERFDADLQAVGLPAVAEPDPSAEDPSAAADWRVAMTAPDPASAYPALVDRLLRAAVPACSLWWAISSEEIAPSLLVCSGLPRIGGYAAFLDGRWEQWGWSTQGAAAAAPPGRAAS